ncbi:MAG: transcriptional regulator GcvA [Roseovarius sp.]
MYRNLPPLNPLRAFEAAARHCSFSKAAEELFVTQGAVSRQVKKLEDYLGAQLFVREANNVHLTQFAKSILPTVSLAFENMNQVFLAMSTAKSAIRLQVMPSFALRILMPRIAEFQDLHQGISIRPSIMLHPPTFDALSFDAAIIYGDGNWPNLYVRQLSLEMLQPVCSPGYLDQNGPLHDPADLAGHTLLHNSTDRRDWPLWLNDADASVPSATDGPAFETMDMAVRAARDGMGIVIADLSLIKRDLDAGKIIRLFDHVYVSGRGIYFVCPKESKDLQSISTFSTWLQSISPIASAQDAE